MSNGIALKQTEAIITLVSRNLNEQKPHLCMNSTSRTYAEKKGGRKNNTDLSQGKVAKESRGSVRLPKGEGRGGVCNLQTGPTVLGSDLSLKGPPVLWVCVESLQKHKVWDYIAEIDAACSASGNRSPSLRPLIQHYTALSINWRSWQCNKLLQRL